MPKKFSLRTGIAGKLVTAVLATFLLAFSVMGFIVYTQVKNEISSATERETQKLSNSKANQVKDSLDQVMSISRTLAQTLEADVRTQHSLTRDDVLAMLRHILDANPNLLGTYVALEPNAFDGKDQLYKNTPGHDATGRFIPYVNKLTGQVTLDPLLDYEKEGIGDYYLIPKKTGRESLLEPYLYQGVMLTSLVVPIKDAKGNFIGIAGCDIGLTQLDDMISQIKVYDTGYASLVSYKGAYLSHPEKVMLGYSTLENLNAEGIRAAFKSGTGLYKKDATEEDVSKIEKMASTMTPEIREAFKKITWDISASQAGIVKFQDNYTGQSQWTFYEPISVGDANTPWGLLINVPPDEALAPLNALVRNLIIIALGTIALITLVVLWSARRIVKPISMTVNILKDIAEGEGDLTKRIDITSNDEAGELASWFNTFVDKLAHVIKNIAQSAGEVEEGSGQLASAIEEQTKAINEVTSVVSQSAKGTQDQNEGVASVRESIAQLSAAIGLIAKGAQEQAVSVERTSEVSTEMVDDVTEAVNMIKNIGAATTTNAEQAALGNQAVNAVVRGMADIKAGTDQALQSVTQLDEGSRQIGAIIEVINGIADQTNLLALNAAIEAARAGEHGKGFAVVADEVRVLAEKAKNSTGEISEIIKGLALAIEQTIRAVKNSGDQVGEGTRLAGEASGILVEIEQTASDTVNGINALLQLADRLDQRSKEVGEAMAGVAAVAQQNSASAEEMTATSDEVVGVMENIASVSEENAASAEEVASLAQQQSATAEEMAASANALAESAAKLKELVSQFKTN